MNTNTQNITKHLKLPFQFDEKLLADDLSTVLEKQWMPHFNTDGYKGNWKVIALYSWNGDPSFIYAFKDGNNPLVETSVLSDCPYFKEVLGHFKCSLTSVRLLKLSAGAAIKPHYDTRLGYEDGSFRLHIPIVTNRKVNFTLDNERLTMLPGECWYTNVNYIHSVSNNGATDRVHLVIDGHRNAWSDKLFFSLAPEESFFPVEEQILSPNMINRMIEELALQNEPATKDLINKLKKLRAKNENRKCP